MKSESAVAQSCPTLRLMLPDTVGNIRNVREDMIFNDLTDVGLLIGCVEDEGRRQWQPTPVFLPGKSHGQRGLAGYSPWGRKRVGQD